MSKEKKHKKGGYRMGTNVAANCKCGLHAEIMIGSGMQTFDTVCLFPCSCAKCRKVVEANLLDPEMKCPECGSREIISYDDPRLSKNVRGKTVEYWGERKLKSGKYPCPACGKKELRFGKGEYEILWD